MKKFPKSLHLLSFLAVFTLSFLLASSFTARNERVNLEAYYQDFVLEIKRITIPDHPYAFNPSIIRWKKDLFLSFREVNDACADLHSAAESFQFIVKLDENFSPVSKPQKLLLTDSNLSTRTEDGRLIALADRLYIIYSDNKDEIVTEGGFRVWIAELDYDGQLFHVVHNECLSQFENANPGVREKNWVPFDYEGNLLLAYSLMPHKIFFPLLNGSGKCETYISTKPSIVWEWGELRGGTPAIIVNDDYYLAFFHSSIPLQTEHSNGMLSLHYFFGAYLFEREPPFKILKVSPEPIVGKNFYRGMHYEPYWKPVNVVFPCGLLITDDVIWVTYGRQDHEIWMVKIDKIELMKSLIPVTSIK